MALREIGDRFSDSSRLSLRRVAKKLHRAGTHSRRGHQLEPDPDRGITGLVEQVAPDTVWVLTLTLIVRISAPACRQSGVELLDEPIDDGFVASKQRGPPAAERKEWVIQWHVLSSEWASGIYFTGPGLDQHGLFGRAADATSC
jgi:hypothetical protein